MCCFFADKMADSVPVSDVVCVDDMGKARVMEPVLADKVADLRDQCSEFMSGNHATDDGAQAQLEAKHFLAAKIMQRTPNRGRYAPTLPNTIFQFYNYYTTILK